MSSLAFYDAHCHALTLAHPSLLAFVESVRRRRLESLLAYASAPNYLVASLFLKGGERIRNMLAVMENDVGSIFRLMEDDLAGRFAKGEDPPPLLAEGSLSLGRLGFDRLVLVPLVMDFGSSGVAAEELYYSTPASKSVDVQVRDLLEGIRSYRRSRPSGFLEIRPFLGIDTRHYDLDSLAAFLERHFALYRRGGEASAAAFDAMRDFDECADIPLSFAGVKVYPPLGFDPWPDADDARGALEREKAELLWSFCEERGIPVTTHCDDQGFRTVSLEESLLYTSPERWAPVLERHPSLRLDFAHFGAQYLRTLGRGPSTEWTDRIVGLMDEYPKVYADFSFDGTESEYYEWLRTYLDELDSGRGELLRDRLIFGSDFVVNLSRVRSYSDYYRIFAASPLSDEERLRFCHDNPERFLFGD
jgi:predicted TIM-barrel fold metal-dependent hydrolase